MSDEHRGLGWVIAGLAVAGAVIAVSVLGLRVAFVASSDVVPGEVASIDAATVCRHPSRGARRSNQSTLGHGAQTCTTVFTAHVTYVPRDGSTQSVALDAGSVPQADAPVTRAWYAKGARVPIRYSVPLPAWAVPDTFADVWAGALMLAAIPTFGSAGMGLFWLQQVRRPRADRTPTPAARRRGGR